MTLNDAMAIILAYEYQASLRTEARELLQAARTVVWEHAEAVRANSNPSRG